MSYDSDLTERLERLTAFGPVSGFDVDRAMSDGLRDRRRRRYAVLSWSIAVLLTCSVGVAVGVGQRGGSAAREPDSTAPYSTATYSPAAALSANDPIQVGAQFGWLPSGMKAGDNYLLGWTSRDDGAWQIALTADPNGPAIELRTLSASLSAQQAASVIDGDPGMAPVNQVPINGRPAYWVAARSTPAKQKTTLMIWRLPDGRWGGLWELSLPSGDSAAVMRHIAETVTDGSPPQAMPLRISGLPKGTILNGGGFRRPGQISGSAWQADLGIGYGGTSYDFTVAPPGFADLNGAIATAGGTLETGPTRCETVKGLQACISADGTSAVPAALSNDGLEGLFKYLTVLGPDPSTWTTDVVQH